MTLPNRPIQLLIVDDHTLFRRGLTALLTQDERLQVMDQVGDVGAALRSVEQQAPDLILLDNHLPGVRGVDAIPAFKKAAPASRILMLTVSEDEADLTAALEAGAEGYLLKTVESDQLCQAIVKVMEGESVVSPEMMTKLVAAFRAKATKPALADIPVTRVAPEQAAVCQLSAREREVLARIALGESNKLIARHLSIAETTVKIHVQHILRKLDLTSRVQAAVYAAALDAD
jgi:two-component system nitrate/nitrite response regulator NarL